MYISKRRFVIRNYVYDIGINANGTTMRISARDVMNFEYTLD